jgi:antitoxin component YwqK of YwqJK toxin-antitoxin module
MQLRKTKLLLFVSGLIALLAWTENVQVISLSSKDLKIVPKGFLYEDQVFSGVIYDFHSTGMLSALTFVVRSQKHGPEIQWYSSGQKFIQRQFYFGEQAGVHYSWYENGSVQSIKRFSNGLPDGDFFDWHPNGQVSQFIRYQQGQEISAKSWSSRGKPFYNYVWSEGSRLGLEGDSFCSPTKLTN